MLKLTKPFPRETQSPAAAPSPWILPLEDGSVGEPQPEHGPAINHEPAAWSCIKPGVSGPSSNSLVSKVHSGSVWTAELYPESAVMTGNSLTQSRRIEVQISPLARVWH